jgi:hypothetical protein
MSMSADFSLAFDVGRGLPPVRRGWEPSLQDVARHIPERTRDASVPGSDMMLMTFTGSTTPTDAQALQTISDAADMLEGLFGSLDTASPDVLTAARVAAEWRAAADIEVAYPNRSADLRLYAQLDARATAAQENLRLMLERTGEGGVIEPFPEWQLPLPSPWGDTSPGSGADYVFGPY